MLNALRFILYISIVVWVGMLIFFTFIVAPSIFKVLPKDLAAALVSEIFPKFWVAGYASGVLSLGSLIAISLIEKGFPAARILLISLMTAVTFYNGMVVNTKAKEVQALIVAAEDPVKKESLRADFKSIHVQSYMLNMVTMASGVAVIYFMARSLRL